jgi:hypothetical protein
VEFNQDLKPLNIMKVGEVWKLIDLDAAAKIGKKAGLKSSTGYVPPELLILSTTVEASIRDPNQDDALTAESSFDMWSFGALLYLMITGETLFNNNTEDNLNNRDLLRLCQWNTDDLEDALDNVHNRRGKHQPLGRDLLQELLQPEASKRPKSFKRVLDHPFFTGQSDGSDLASKAIIERVEVAITEIGLVGEGVERNSKKLDQIAEKLCGLEQMGLDQIEGKHKCPSAMLLLGAEDEIPAVWTDVWEMVETEEETRLAELEEQRRVLQAQAAELVENINQVVPPQSTWGRGFFAHKHTKGTSAEVTVETINSLFTNIMEVTLGFVEWMKGMGGVFESIYTRTKNLHEEEEADVKKVVELVKLAIIVAKDISSFFKDLRQWYHFVSGALKQWKKGTNTGKQPLTKIAKKALKNLQHTCKNIRGSVKKKLQQALKWGILNNTKIIETCEVVLNALISESFDDDAEGDGEGEDDEGCEGEGDDGADAHQGGGDGGQDFMSDMKSYCFRKFGQVAEDKLNRRAKIYDKVQIYLLCEYEGCHVPQGIYA